MQLFDLPARLSRDAHAAVFGDLPSRLAHELDTPEVAAAVRPLLDRGWRPGQLASRVGVLPAGPDPVRVVLDLLHSLAGASTPSQVWAAEQADRQALRSVTTVEQPASPESRERWIAQIRSGLSGPRTTRPQPAGPRRPACALCGQASTYFVTHGVRLCPPCVEVLASGSARLKQTG